MNQVEIGKFIARCRKEKKLTQAQLAEKLNITDRAISKWETGKSMPDSSIMLELCEILGITVNELLSGEIIDMDNYEKKADENLIALKRKDENNMNKNMIFSIVFSITLLIGIIVCAICDIAISGDLTWSLIPISSIVFTWVVSIPFIILGKKGIIGSLLSVSIFIIPYLYILSDLVNVKAVFSVGTIMAIASIVFLWLIFIIFNRLKAKKLVAAGITFLISIPFMFIVNIILSRMISEPIIDVWDILSAFILMIFAFTFFVCNYAKSKGLVK
ncbi:helix-turn-helix domain-containing protein [Lachnospiraceae bacterium MD1]|uniref:Helix-turn-helix domain-containing protein n=1 Tax=Variimorphobacter saccharofermentans TaxID=2755051 RepID=A0A839K0F1_9FIRM|nr:helix-turn-helix transcriptional regulator [Variimorphobacter saccharofermentans]MBB2182211.1 helix-turn-helix domain-containing protein [Variimorphobacter saccharofermentans]